MSLPGSSGTTLIYYYPGNPTSVSTAIINPPLGSIVIDTTTPAIWQKTTALGDNSGYSGGSTGTWTAPLIANGLTASGSVANTFAGSTGTFITSTGLNTLSGKVAFKSIATPVAAAGSSGSDAAALGSANTLYISSDSAAKGVKLVAGVAGDKVFIYNTSGTAAILYAATGGTINGLSANAGVLIPASKGTILDCSATNTWLASDMAARSTAA